MAQQVATEFGCSIAAARSAVSRARKVHPEIPYDYGHTIDGTWRQCGGHDPRWVAAVTRARKIAAARRAATPTPAPVPAAQATTHAERTAPPPPAPKVPWKHPPRSERKFTPPRPTGRPHACDDCGHQAPTGWELAAHTLDAHGRTLTATERTPRTEEAA